MANPSFVVGETYQDRQGLYKVIAVDGDSIVCEYADGTQRRHSAEVKWRIHQNIASEQNPSFLFDGEFWRYEEISPIFAEIIMAYGEQHQDFMTHVEMVAAFTAHPKGQLILSRPHDDRPNSYWVGVMKAHFSRKYNRGNTEWDDYFEPREVGEHYHYRVRRKKRSPHERQRGKRRA